MRGIIFALAVLSAPLSACMNDSRSPMDEAEYKARYTSLASATGVPTWRGVLLGGLGATSLAILSLGIGFWWRERQSAIPR